ncbi:AraC family transcriptional regulator [Paenibacillus anseongense]|uniref:helix-turn-helix domain-containing protein n=1 Tax=Paenibacillus anseongense TaxID=2682845 RepID=UPI002DB7D608|nr:AraC family transcriptional regulator [Paenibacillus anseongense]MEC0270524.1 AraC family transcriptional regulator [Paenibacillus anseongense]
MAGVLIDETPEHSLKNTDRQPAYILHAIEYIRIHYASDITLNEVADTVGLYPTYLSEQFKLHTGGTFIDFITQVRVERAKNLLRKSVLPAFTICEEVGYATPAHFSKVFKKWVGCTPTEYRERY